MSSAKWLVFEAWSECVRYIFRLCLLTEATSNFVSLRQQNNICTSFVNWTHVLSCMTVDMELESQLHVSVAIRGSEVIIIFILGWHWLGSCFDMKRCLLAVQHHRFLLFYCHYLFQDKLITTDRLRMLAALLYCKISMRGLNYYNHHSCWKYFPCKKIFWRRFTDSGLKHQFTFGHNMYLIWQVFQSNCAAEHNK